MSINRADNRSSSSSSASRSEARSVSETAKVTETVKPEDQAAVAFAEARKKDTFEAGIKVANNTTTPSAWAAERGLYGVEATKTNANKYGVS